MTKESMQRFIRNIIYCEDTHSLAHRMYDKWKYKFPESKLQARQDLREELHLFLEELEEKGLLDDLLESTPSR